MGGVPLAIVSNYDEPNDTRQYFPRTQYCNQATQPSPKGPCGGPQKAMDDIDIESCILMLKQLCVKLFPNSKR